MPKASILKRLVAELANSTAEFEKEIKAGNGVIGRAWRDNTDLSDGLIRKILKRYPHVNEKWLETGLGEMLLSDKSPPQTIKEEPAPYRNAKPGDAYRDKYEALLEKTHGQLSDALATVLAFAKDISFNLNKALDNQDAYMIMQDAYHEAELDALSALQKGDKKNLWEIARNKGISQLGSMSKADIGHVSGKEDTG